MNTTKTGGITRKFPDGVLTSPVEERVEYFKRTVSKHVAMSAAFDEALEVIGGQTGPKVVILTGPTGVGKSSTSLKLYQSLRDQFIAEGSVKADDIPVMWGTAVASLNGSFGWRDFFVRLLKDHGDILAERKISVPRQSELFPNPTAPEGLNGWRVDRVRRAAESCLRNRHTRVLIIDEAHHLLLGSFGARLEQQFELIKSLSIETNATIVLCGTYKLMEIRDQSAQLVRRSKIIHFPRYHLEVEKDANAFASALMTLQKHLPVKVMPDLVSNSDYYLTKSAGCVGILKDWMTRALGLSLRSGLPIDKELMDKCAMTNRELETVILEALDGESKLEDISFESLVALMQTSAGPARPSAPRSNSKPGQRKPGERKPVRDPVGQPRAA